MFLIKNKSMKYLYALLLANLWTISSLQSAVKTIEKEDEFVCLIDQSKPTIVMGSMEACPHCVKIAPTFEDLSKKHKNISFVKANGKECNVHGAVKRESKGKGDFTILGYPAFVFIKDKQIDSVVLGGSPEILEKAIKEFDARLQQDSEQCSCKKQKKSDTKQESNKKQKRNK